MMDLIWTFQKLFFKKLKNDLELPFHPRRLPFLVVVVKNPGIAQKDIAKALNVEPPTVAITLKRMEKDGLVKRKSDLYDRRILRVYPTERAEEVYKEMKEKVSKLENEILKNFDPEEISCVEGVFQKFIDILSKEEG